MPKYLLPKNPLAVALSIIAFAVAFSGFRHTELGALALSIPFSLNSFVAGGRSTMVYEIGLINNLSNVIRITDLIVKNEKDQILETLTPAELEKAFQSEDTLQASALSLSSGGQGVIYLEIVLDNNQLPQSLNHTIISTDLLTGKIFTDHVSNEVHQKSALVLGAPLQTGIWAAIYNPEWPRGHRRVIYKTGGIDRIPGRFAIDFMKLDDEGHYAKGDENVIANWYGYGADVLAVADGVVASTRDDFKESKTISDHPEYPAEKATGNYISIKIDDRHYAFYEHLKPKSILVKKGQAIKKGQVIAKLGFTGQTTGPHLHLHIADSDSPLGAEGLPFAFKEFKLEGTYPDFTVFGTQRWTDSNKVVTNEHPQSNSVIRF
ncbi:MAG: M23 family metallopeptidase [Chryseolinea sp.]